MLIRKPPRGAGGGKGGGEFSGGGWGALPDARHSTHSSLDYSPPPPPKGI